MKKDTNNPKDILIIKNVSHEGPGILGNLIDELGIGKKIVDLCENKLNEDPSGYGAVIVLGGPGSANDQSPEMIAELEFIRDVLARGIPYLGICLGMQTLVKAAGGTVIKCPVKETGFRDMKGEIFTVTLTADGYNDPLFDGLDSSFVVFHIHGETVNLTENIKLLGKGKTCLNQIVKIGSSAYGMQCHFELTGEMFGTWMTEDQDLRNLDHVQLRNDFLELKEGYYSTGIRLFSNFLKLAGYAV